MSAKSMDVFSLRDHVVREYEKFATSFTTIHADDIRAQVEATYAEDRYWPEPLIQINPQYKRSTTVEAETAAGTLHPKCAEIFRADGETLSLYDHQKQAIALASQGETAAAWYAEVVQNVMPRAFGDLWDGYDERMSEWSGRHGLAWATTGVSLPPLFVRRLDDDVELSWDTATIPAPDRRYRFLAEPGFATVPVERWLDTVDGCLRAVDDRGRQAGVACSLDPAERRDPWRLLLPPSLRDPGALTPELESELSLATRTSRPRRWARQTWVTRALGALPPTSTVLDATRVVAWIDRHVQRSSSSDTLSNLAHPEHAPRTGAWEKGYARARELRRELSRSPSLGVGRGPVESMTGLLRQLGVQLEPAAELPDPIRAAAVWRPDEAPRVSVRTDDVSRRSFGLAVELGHLLMDERVDDTLVSVWTPYADAARYARARAFAAMFLMPEEAVRRHPCARADLTLDGLFELAETFHVTPRTAVLHLQNLRIVAKTKRLALEAALQAIA